MNSEVDSEISFDENGVCKHCQRFDRLVSSRMYRGQESTDALERIVTAIKHAGKESEYDCIIGVSGGVDSTYVALLAKRLGLRPLAVHFDNGWNSELAVKNIERVVKALEIDLFTYVVDWLEFSDLQVAFLRASTPDGEIPTDHAIFATLWREAEKRGIKYILSGMNFATESGSVPNWAYGHSDWRYIKDVHANYGTRKLRTYPHFSLSYLAWLNVVRGIRTVSILNFVDYNKERAMAEIEAKLGWKYYGGKHFESIYTRFYQGFLLPRKFKIDKRYGHLSDLIKVGQISREAALGEVLQPPYPEDQQMRDVSYVIKKLRISEDDFTSIMRSEPRSFRAYRNSYSTIERLRSALNWCRRVGLYPR